MTTEQFYQKFNELKETASKVIDSRAGHLLNSGAIDLESAEDNYLLPRIVLASCLKEAADQVPPIGKVARRAVANLRKF